MLSGHDDTVDYQPSDPGPWLTRLQAELQACSGVIGVPGGLHGDFSAMNPDDLVDPGDPGVAAASDTINDLAMPGTDEMQYIPWMQASYIMAASRQALEYPPEGADIDALTYDQLIEWAANVQEATGEAKFGFPAGPKGLKHRELREHTNPASTNFSFLQEQLLSGDAWIVFDHTSRLARAFNERPDDFVAFPAPAGPAGRGFMPVLAGLAVPRTAPGMDAARSLVACMLKPETQIATLRATNFFPVVDVDLPDDLPAVVQAAGNAVATMSGSADANPGLLPAGLGDKGGDFNRVFVDTFERIVLAGQNIRTVLDDQKEKLRAIMEAAGAPCWAPDEPSEGACPVSHPV